MEDLDNSTTCHSIEDLEETRNPLGNSGIEILSIPTLMEQNHEQS